MSDERVFGKSAEERKAEIEARAGRELTFDEATLYLLAHGPEAPFGMDPDPLQAVAREMLPMDLR